MKPKLHVGCSAYDNGFWTEVFYPVDLTRNERFKFYCKYFNTFEINSTFYTFPTKRVLKNWAEKSPDDFLFSVKSPQDITHKKRFENTSDDLKRFYDACQNGIGAKLGCVLFQFPPSYSYSEERLDNITQQLDPAFNNVVEFRHISWWRQEVYDRLMQSKIVFCSVSYPNLPNEIIVTGKVGYIRLHGYQKLFYSGYSYSEALTLYQEVNSKGFSEVFVYYNNTASIAGILNALEMNVLTGM